MELITRETQIQERQFDAGLFASFVAWIDRSDKTTRSYITNLRQFMAWLQHEPPQEKSQSPGKGYLFGNLF